MNVLQTPLFRFAIVLWFSLPLICRAQITEKRVVESTAPLQMNKAFNEAEVRASMKNGGLSEQLINLLVKQQKKLAASGRNVNWSMLKQLPGSQAACSDLGVENGWGSWSAAVGYNADTILNPTQLNSNITWNPSTAPAATNNVNLTTGTGIDPNTPGPNPGNPTIPVVCPGFGNTSIVMNPNCSSGGLCEQLTYPLTVTSSDTNFVYAYAIVIQDGNSSSAGGGPTIPHTQDNQPYVEFGIYDANGNPIGCSYQRYAGGDGAVGFYPVGQAFGCAVFGADVYKPWTLVGVNLSGYVGQTLYVVITNVDCSLGGHFVKSYWDFICGTQTLRGGCVGSQSNICGPTDPNIAYNYQWYRNNTAMPGPMGNQQCISVIPAPGDTFKVFVTNPSGCGFFMAYTPEFNQPSFTASGQCGVMNYIASGNPVNGATVTGYNWSFPNGTPSTSTLQNPTVQYPSQGSYTATLSVSYSNGCSFDTTQTITLSGSPLDAAFTNDTVCAGVSTSFIDNSFTLPSDPITVRNWLFPTGTPSSSGSAQPVVTFPAGTHQVYLTVNTAAGCIDSIRKTIIVHENPVAGFSAPGNVCPPYCSAIQNNSSSADGLITDNYWTFQGGTPANANAASPNVCWNNSGSYDISLVVNTQYGCKDTLVLPDAVNVLSAPAGTIAGDARVCMNADQPIITFSGWNSTAPYTFEYTVNGVSQQIISNTNGNATLPVSTNTAGTQTFIITGIRSSTQPSCFSSANQQVNVIIDPLPEADFEAIPKDCPYSPVIRFNNKTSNGKDYYWNFGDGTTSTKPSPEHYYLNADDYDISLIAISPFGCIDSTSKTISVEQDFRIWYPNSFTPNGDQKNEIFYPVFISASKVVFSIYNRWGKKIFESTEMGEGWDGNYNGVPAEEATYVFRVEAEDLCSKKHSYTGKFYLVR